MNRREAMREAHVAVGALLDAHLDDEQGDLFVGFDDLDEDDFERVRTALQTLRDRHLDAGS